MFERRGYVCWQRRLQAMPQEEAAKSQIYKQKPQQQIVKVPISTAKYWDSLAKLF